MRIMGFSAVIDITDEQSTRDRVQLLCEQHIRQAAHAQVGRAGRTGSLLRRFEIDLQPDDDVNAVCRDLAGALVSVAEDDVGDKSARYTFSILGPATAKQKASALGSITIKVGDGDGDDVSAAKVGGAMLRDVGERHLKLLDVTLGALERLQPLMAAGAAADTAAVGLQVELRKIQLDHDRWIVERKDFYDLVGAGIEFTQQNKGLIDGIAALIKAKAAQIFDSLNKDK